MAGMIMESPPVPYAPMSTSGAAGGGGLDYLSVFVRRKRLIVIPTIIGVMIALGVARMLPKQYQGETIVEVFDRSAIDKMYQGMQFTADPKTYLGPTAEFVKTRQFLAEPIQQIGIEEGYDTSDPRQRAQLMERVRKNIEVEVNENPRQGSSLVLIRYTGRDPAKVTNFLNAIRTKYMKLVQDTYWNEIGLPRTNAKARFDDARRAYEAAVDNYRAFQARNSFPETGEKTPIAMNQARIEAQNKIRELETEREGKERRLDKLNQTLLNVPEEFVRATNEQKNQKWLDQQKVVEGLEQKLQFQRSRGIRADSEWLKPLLAQIEAAKAELATIPERVVVEAGESRPNDSYSDLLANRSALEADLSDIKARIESYKKTVEVLTGITEKLPDLLAEQKKLENEEQLARAAFQTAGTILERAESSYNRVISKEGIFYRNLRVPNTQEAADWEPVFPKPVLFMGIGGFAGFLIGAGIAFIREFAARSFVTVKQVRRVLPVPLLGEIGLLPSSAEVTRTSLRRRLAAGTAGLFVAAVLATHVCFFVKSLRTNLPPAVYNVMTKVYGPR